MVVPSNSLPLQQETTTQRCAEQRKFKVEQ